MDHFLVVFPDRVDLVNTGRKGSMLRSGAGTDTIPIARISSTECRNAGIWSVLEVHTSGNMITFRTDVVSGPYLRQAILDQINASGMASANDTTAPADVMQQLQQLGELHHAGVLTDEEFAAKKTELLGRF